MKIRIKKRLNEGKGANIIARGLNINLLSDNAKRIFNKFGGFEEVMQGDEETINQVIELITGLSFKDKESLENDLNVFKELARLSEIEVLKHKKNYKEMEEQFITKATEMGYEYTDIKDFIEDKGVPEYDLNLLVSGLRDQNRYRNVLFRGNPSQLKYDFADPMVDPSRNMTGLMQQ